MEYSTHILNQIIQIHCAKLFRKKLTSIKLSDCVSSNIFKTIQLFSSGKIHSGMQKSASPKLLNFPSQ